MRPVAQPYRPELFEFFGEVHARRMFGGAGLFAGDVMIGILSDEIIYLKTDDATREAFIAEGAGPFTYRTRDGSKVAMSYYEVPERLYDEPEEFAEWVRRAYAVAERTDAVRRKRRVLAPGRKPGKKPVRR